MLENDLYDEMVLHTGKEEQEPEEKPDGADHEKYSVYISNFSWWTTDQELLDLVASAGITDLVDINIHYNPSNGLSKGYATVTVDSHVSLRLLNNLKNKTINNRTISVSEFTLANMLKHETSFDEMIFKKSCNNSENIQSSIITTPVLPFKPVMSPSLGVVLAPSISHTQVMTPPIPYSQIIVPTLNHQLMAPPPLHSLMTSPLPHQMLNPHPNVLTMPPYSPLLTPPPHLHFVTPPPCHPSFDFIVGIPAKHCQKINNDRSQEMGNHQKNKYKQGIATEASACVPIRQYLPTDSPSKIHNSCFPSNKRMLTKEEFDEVYDLNRTVVECSLERAMQDAHTGHFTEAIDTLVTAISIIKESRLGSDPQGIALMKPLQELLQDIEMESSKQKNIPSKKDKARSLSPTPLIKLHQRKAKKRKRSPSPRGEGKYSSRSRSPRASSYSDSRSFRDRDKHRRMGR